MNYWIDIVDAITGARYGTLRTALQLSITTLLDRSGHLQFTMPVADAQIDLLQPRRVVQVWGIVNDQVTELGAGVIVRLAYNDADLTVTVECEDLLSELTGQTVGQLWLADEVIEHPARVWFLAESGGATTVHEVTETTDYQPGDTTTEWMVPAEGGVGGHNWRPYNAEPYGGDILYIAAFKPFSSLHVKRGVTAATVWGTPDWRVQYYDVVSGGWQDVSLTTKSCWVGPNIFAQDGVLAWDIPSTWGLQNPTYELRIFHQGSGLVENLTLADLSIGYVKPTAEALARIMAHAPDGWSLDAANGYTATQPPQPTSAELCANGDFATYSGTQDDGVTDSFTAWTIGGTDAGNRIEATATAYSGSNAVKIVAATTGTPLLYQDIAVTPLTEYILRFWTRGNGTSELLYRFANGATGEILSHWSYTGCTGTNWVSVQRRLAIPPQITSLRITFSATVGTAYLDAVSFQQVNAGEVYLELSDESVLEALNRLTEQTGEHFIRGTGRTVRWLGHDERKLPLWLSNGGDAQAKQEQSSTGHITALVEEQTGYELVSRVYVYGGSMGDQRVTLAACTRTPPAGYTLNKLENYLERDEVGYRRTDKVLELSDIVPYDLSAAAQTDAANALFDRALIWLQTHSAGNTDRLTGDQPRAYTVEVLGCNQLLQPGHLVRVTYIDSAPTHLLQRLDDWLWLLEATLQIAADGVPRWRLTLATVAALARREAEAQWTEDRINRAIRRRGNLPLSPGAGVIIAGGMVDHGGLSGLGDDDHTQYLRTDGTRAGAIDQRQEFTSGVKTGNVQVLADSAEAFKIVKASDVDAIILDVSTSTVRLGVGTAPDNAIHAIGAARLTQGVTVNDGTVGLPSYRFTGDSDTGMYRPGVGGIGFTVDGAQVVGITTDKRLQLLTPDGTAPFDLISTTVNANLNADMVDGQHANAFWLVTDATIDGGYFLDTYSGSPFSVDGGSFV